MLESSVVAKLKKRWESEFAFFFKIHGHAMQKPGMPDIYVSHPRWGQWWIEVKVGERSVDLLQRIRVEHLRISGAKAVVLRFREGDVFVDERSGEERLCHSGENILAELTRWKTTGVDAN